MRVHVQKNNFMAISQYLRIILEIAWSDGMNDDDSSIFSLFIKHSGIIKNSLQISFRIAFVKNIAKFLSKVDI